MRSTTRVLGAAVVLVLVLVGWSPAVAGAGPDDAGTATWEVVDLGTLPGASTSGGHAINDRGWVVGASWFPDGSSRAFLWREGRMTDLGTLAGGSGSAVANALNNRGDVVGASSTEDGESHATLWRDGRKIDLGTLGGPNSAATGVNERGDVVGYSTLPGGEIVHGFLWRRGRMTDLGAPEPPSHSYARAINDRGEIVGERNGAAIWRRGTVALLPSLVPGAMSGAAFDNADNGDVAGFVLMPEGPANRAVVWRDGTAVDLGWEQGTSQAFGVNSRGQAVGWRELAGQFTWEAFVWERGTMTALPALTGRFGAVAQGVNERGEVVGVSPAPGGDPEIPVAVQHAVVWRPSDT